MWLRPKGTKPVENGNALTIPLAHVGKAVSYGEKTKRQLGMTS